MEGGYGLTGGWDSLWDWQTADATQFLWDCHNQDDDELLGLLGNQTPPRDCCDFFADLGDITYKETLDLEESQESKRQRTLEYPSESSQSKVASHETGSPFVTPEVAEVSLLCTNEPQSLNCDMEYTSNNLDTIKSMSNEAPYEQEDNHLEHYYYGNPVYIEPDQVPCSWESIAHIHDDQIGISGTSKIAPTTESFVMQETRKPSTLKVSKGTSKIAPTTESFVMQETRKPSTLKVSKGTSEIAPTTESFVMQETRKPSTVKVSKAFPFALIKLSREEGDITLHQDINQQNQRIHAPPKKAPEILGTSHLSGKPVIGMTRIRTSEGGRGSIIILRTKD